MLDYNGRNSYIIVGSKTNKDFNNGLEIKKIDPESLELVDGPMGPAACHFCELNDVHNSGYDKQDLKRLCNIMASDACNPRFGKQKTFQFKKA